MRDEELAADGLRELIRTEGVHRISQSASTLIGQLGNGSKVIASKDELDALRAYAKDMAAYVKEREHEGYLPHTQDLKVMLSALDAVKEGEA